MTWMMNFGGWLGNHHLNGEILITHEPSKIIIVCFCPLFFSHQKWDLHAIYWPFSWKKDEQPLEFSLHLDKSKWWLEASNSNHILVDVHETTCWELGTLITLKIELVWFDGFWLSFDVTSWNGGSNYHIFVISHEISLISYGCCIISAPFFRCIPVRLLFVPWSPPFQKWASVVFSKHLPTSGQCPNDSWAPDGNSKIPGAILWECEKSAWHMVIIGTSNQSVPLWGSIWSTWGLFP